MTKKILYTFLFLIGIWFLLFCTKTFAETEVTYKATYKDALSYDVIIKGIEGNDEQDYMYSAMICQEQDVEASDFLAALGKSFNIDYNEEEQQWEGNTLEAHNGVKLYDTFERTGQYYAYVARLKKGSTHYEILDGPTEIETPEIPALGNRIDISIAEEYTNYYIQVNAHNTMLHNKVQRTLQYYLGEITDEKLLQEIDEKGTGAYSKLLEYAKEQKNYIKTGEFQDTTTGTLDYNIIEGAEIETGKYYFLYLVLDDEDGTYIPVEDIAAYNGYKSKSGIAQLVEFDYEPKGEGQEENPNTNEQTNEIEQNEQNENKNQLTDNTVANKPIPQTGEIAIAMLVVGVVLVALIFYIQYRKYREMK